MDTTSVADKKCDSHFDDDDADDDDDNDDDDDDIDDAKKFRVFQSPTMHMPFFGEFNQSSQDLGES